MVWQSLLILFLMQGGEEKKISFSRAPSFISFLLIRNYEFNFH